jgi:predicted Zn-ribbon and HTH transcriptional regulator
MAATPHKFQCPSCGAGMEWDPSAGKLKCPSCKSEREIAPQGSVDEIPFGDFAAQERRLTDTALEVQCSNCGATTQFEPGEVASRCPFCATAIVMQPKAADPLIAPHGVLPFSVARERATEAVKAWLGGLWFAPNDLNRVAQQDGMQGVYIPYWTYDAETQTLYQGERGTYYQDQRGQRQIEWQDCSGAVACSFDDMLTPATTAVQPSRLDALEPWSLQAVKPYEPAFLAGFKAQRYQVDLKQGFDYASGKMRPMIEQLIRRDIGGDQQQVSAMRTEYGDVTFKHVLLPVWIGAYRYQGKLFQVVVNAQRGTVSGERPVSAWKVALAVAAALIVLWVWAQTQQ